MIKINMQLPRNIVVAVSGGVDSMAALDFLSRNHKIIVAFFNHGTKNSDLAEEFVRSYCRNRCYSIPLYVGRQTRERFPKESLEEYWRTTRYEFLNSFSNTVITAHHLDDCIETWIWSSLHGAPTLPHSISNNVVRPFLTTKKQDLVDWAVNKNIPWIEDNSNKDTKFTRNYIRHDLMPHALHVNPGLAKVIRKKLINRDT